MHLLSPHCFFDSWRYVSSYDLDILYGKIILYTHDLEMLLKGTARNCLVGVCPIYNNVYIYIIYIYIFRVSNHDFMCMLD